MANAIRALSMDAVEGARSGHLGLPLGMADAATVLFTKFLKHNPDDPDWPDRDRFILSAGHGCMLVYAFLHLTGYASISRDHIRRFRQLGQPTPGHPENFLTRGIETTTGPLGQGIAMAVGMAIAERRLNARFGDDIVNHKTYVIAGDGCLMEGLSQEAITLAGHMKLSGLIVLFDDNAVTIDGHIGMTDNTDQCARFAASGWRVRCVDGHDPEDVENALNWAQDQAGPVMLAVKTIIGYGARRAGTATAHGGPYGAGEIAEIRKRIGWPHPPFVIPDAVEAAWKAAGRRSLGAWSDWQGRLAACSQRKEFEETRACHLPGNLSRLIRDCKQSVIACGRDDATRKWSGNVLEELTKSIPQMLGGSADLTGSNNTRSREATIITPDNRGGDYIHYGIREHAMAAAMNGMARHGGIIPYGGTFLAFSDYSRAAIRLGALMGERVIHVLTHDSIGLGEDGPTHQPVEQLAALRAMPNLLLFRPCDGVETAECWELALRNGDGPSALALSRQTVKSIRLHHDDENLSARGGYGLPGAANVQAVIIATGSEVGIATEAQKILDRKGIPVRVVSMPCMELFAQQPDDYQRETLGFDLPKVAVEAGVRFGWERWIGPDGGFVGMCGFGASAPREDLYRHFGIDVDAVVAEVEKRV